MATLRQISVNASKCQIYDKNAKMLQNNIHGTHIKIDTEWSATLVDSCNKVPPVGRMSSQKMGICKGNLFSASYTALWVNIYTIFIHSHKYFVNIYLYTMWVNIFTMFAQYFPNMCGYRLNFNTFCVIG